MEKGRPIFSVIMPVKNGEYFISDAINSVIYQTEGSWELLVIDDGSTDSTCSIVKNFSLCDARCKLVRNTGSGVSSARNLGMKLAVGKILCFLDADDVFTHNSLSLRLQFFHKNASAWLTHGFVIFVDSDYKPLDFRLGTEKKIKFSDMSGMPTHLNAFSGKSELLKKYVFDVSYKNGEDWLFLASILRDGYVSHSINQDLALYRIHPNSVIKKNMTAHETGLLRVIDWLYKNIEEKSSNFDPKLSLSSPEKSVLICARQLGEFLWLILDGAATESTKKFNNPTFIKWLNEQTDHDILHRISMVGMRYFCIPRSQLQQISFEQKVALLNSIKNNRLDKFFPKIFECLTLFFKL